MYRIMYRFLGPRMERETPGQRPRPNYGHPHPNPTVANLRLRQRARSRRPRFHARYQLDRIAELPARKVIKTRGHFPSDDAAIKLLGAALQKHRGQTDLPIKEWPRILNIIAVYFPGKIPANI